MGTRLYYVQLFDKKVINIDFLIHKLGADKKILRLFQGLKEHKELVDLFLSVQKETLTYMKDHQVRSL